MSLQIAIPTHLTIPPEARPCLHTRRRAVAGLPSGHATELEPTVCISDGGLELPFAAPPGRPQGLG